MLGVFLLPAFTRLGHDCQDLLSPCDGMHVCTDKNSIYTLIWKSLREWTQNSSELQGKNSLYQRLRGGSNPRSCNTQGSQPNTPPTELLPPPPPPPPSPHPTHLEGVHDFWHINTNSMTFQCVACCVTKLQLVQFSRMYANPCMTSVHQSPWENHTSWLGLKH